MVNGTETFAKYNLHFVFLMTPAVYLLIPAEILWVLCPDLHHSIWFLCLFLFISFSGMALMLIGDRWKKRRSYKKLYDKRPDIGTDYSWKIDTDSLALKIGDMAETTLSWPFILRAIETPNGFLLFTQKFAFHWFPYQVFKTDEEITTFRSLLREKVRDFKPLGPETILKKRLMQASLCFIVLGLVVLLQK